jgi:hypothetical protein
MDNIVSENKDNRIKIYLHFKNEIEQYSCVHLNKNASVM